MNPKIKLAAMGIALVHPSSSFHTHRQSFNKLGGIFLHSKSNQNKSQTNSSRSTTALILKNHNNENDCILITVCGHLQ